MASKKPVEDGDAELIYKRELARRLSVSETTIRRWEIEGKIPQPAVLPSGRKAWRVSEIKAWADALPKSEG